MYLKRKEYYNMNIIKKTATVSAALCVCACVAFTGCSETEVTEVNKPLSDEEKTADMKKFSAVPKVWSFCLTIITRL